MAIIYTDPTGKKYGLDYSYDRAKLPNPTGNAFETGDIAGLPSISEYKPTASVTPPAPVATPSTTPATASTTPATPPTAPTAAKTYSPEWEQANNDFIAFNKSFNFDSEAEKEWAPIVENISNTYQTKIKRMEEANKAIESNVYTAGLVSGRARYMPGESEAQQIRVMEDGMNRIKELESNKQALIAQAKATAMSNAKDKWKTFNDQLTAVRDAEKSKYDATMQLFNDNMAIEKYASEKAKNERDAIERMAQSGITLDQISPTNRSIYEEAAGLGKGVFDSYYTALYNVQQTTNTLDKIKAASSIIDLLTKIPAGQTIPIGGADYTGIGDTTDISTSQETDKKTGQAVIFAYNKRTREITVTPTGVRVANPGGGTGAPKAGVYFTKPKPDGSIGYYYGDDKRPVSEAQELTSQNYYKAKSASEGALNPMEEFITPEYLRSMIDESSLRDAAKAAGYDKNGDFWAADQGVGEQDITDYLNNLVNTKVASMRKAGYNDQEIMKEIAG